MFRRGERGGSSRERGGDRGGRGDHRGGDRDDHRGGDRSSRRTERRPRNTTRFQLGNDVQINYKNIPLMQRFLNERGKIVPRRISGISAKEQRSLSRAIKQARFLALLPTGGVKK